MAKKAAKKTLKKKAPGKSAKKTPKANQRKANQIVKPTTAKKAVAKRQTVKKTTVLKQASPKKSSAKSVRRSLRRKRPPGPGRSSSPHGLSLPNQQIYDPYTRRSLSRRPTSQRRLFRSRPRYRRRNFLLLEERLWPKDFSRDNECGTDMSIGGERSCNGPTTRAIWALLPLRSGMLSSWTGAKIGTIFVRKI